LITTRGADTTITSQHRSEVDATIENSSIFPHSDWLALSDRIKPISMPYLQIFATGQFKSDHCKNFQIQRYDWFATVRRSKPIRMKQVLRFAMACAEFRTM
jgi:hypothetical protein